ncbi:unnamed protein product [Dibothriocephalus latus]|uniref:Rho-GAP domain-containing protein n=1 Tax=Dibothriocephalus latus TaxID=60516 RepID=A0A3P7NNX8_DIBLA|nr:unnamed protein product [Dibothriocephalus latus]
MVLEKCITELERRGGLNFEGIFRVPGSHEVVEAFRIALDKDCEGVDLSEKRCPDPNTITSLIKSFLRQLPIPLITYETYPDFIEAVLIHIAFASLFLVDVGELMVTRLVSPAAFEFGSGQCADHACPSCHVWVPSVIVWGRF